MRIVMRKTATVKVVLVVAALLVMATVGLACTMLRGDGSPTAEQTVFCWGTLKRGDVAALSVHSLQRYASNEGDLKGTTRADCEVGAGLNEHGAMKQPQFRLTVDGSPMIDVWYMADDVAGVSPFRAPIAGVPGWVNRSMAGVLLPASCSGKLQFGSPLYVRLKAEDDQKATWRDGTLQKRMADVLMTSATRLTLQLGCSNASFKTSAAAPRLLEKHAPTAGKACGLPGFSTPAKYTEEYVAEGDFRLWSCSLRAGSEELHFTVTQDPYLIWLNGSESGPWSKTLKCDGRQTLVQTGSDDAALTRSFRTAVARKGNCT
ncbi:hypothetical protein ACIRU3_40670 [Streptomyces sp. NPDC101151]|uniref:hypothetical protein n=1 Tax=Streptomyces sp. NPDC101151 TaxID=3366115 RepID=UPI00382D915C